jgi:hypothetical protein
MNGKIENDIDYNLIFYEIGIKRVWRVAAFGDVII